jgi:hypothetical protein
MAEIRLKGTAAALTLLFAGLLTNRALHAICSPQAADDKLTVVAKRKLSHEETLQWITKNKAWRPARKTRPIWARPVAPEEEGKEFQTADHVKEVARKGSWLCVGFAEEPWFQRKDQIDGKYEPDGDVSKKFDFDAKPRKYGKFKPKGTVRNWVARVDGREIEGFYIRPGYDRDRPLYSPAGGYVVMADAPDPYQAKPNDVWLVQEALFKSTYELVPAAKADAERKRSEPTRAPGPPASPAGSRARTP